MVVDLITTSAAGMITVAGFSVLVFPRHARDILVGLTMASMGVIAMLCHHGSVVASAVYIAALAGATHRHEHVVPRGASTGQRLAMVALIWSAAAVAAAAAGSARWAGSSL